MRPSYKASEKLNNRLEQDHYNMARDYFIKSGDTEKHIESIRGFFDNFDEAKPDIIEEAVASKSMKDDYIQAAKKFSTKRANEIIDLAVKDHKDNPKQNETNTKSGSWRKA